MGKDESMSKIALITGATRGIGKEIARQLSELGVDVLVGGRSLEAAQEAASEIGGSASGIQLDVNDEASVLECAEAIRLAHGRLDVLVNNAGISGDLAKSGIGGSPVIEGQQVFETNVWGAIRVTEAMLPLLRLAPAARIVFMSSSVGSLTRMADVNYPFAQYLPPFLTYPVSKAALNMVTVQYAKGLRSEGILVNAADPGACDTDFTRSLDRKIERTAADGARIATRLALLDADGPTATLTSDQGPVPW
jgi:NAD(P)-dependent dehydrogenase (short-subunit alcohol dehydrogenase family)